MTIDEIRRYIRVEILNDVSRQIAEDENLLLTEILTSMSVTMLVAELETRCKINIPPEDITVENFSTLDNIVAYVDQRVGADN